MLYYLRARTETFDTILVIANTVYTHDICLAAISILRCLRKFRILSIPTTICPCGISYNLRFYSFASMQLTRINHTGYIHISFKRQPTGSLTD